MVGGNMQYRESINLPCSCPEQDGSLPLGYERISGRGGVGRRVTVLPGGIRVKKEGIAAPPQGGGKRGQIYGFSDESQRRMTDWMMGIPWGQLDQGDVYFLSLTWHYGYTSSPKLDSASDADGAFVLTTVPADVLGRDQPDNGYIRVDWTVADPPMWHEKAKAFRRRLEREYGDRFMGAVWKKEFQARGAPHYHLVVFFRPGRGPDPNHFARWVAGAWNEVVEPGDVHNLRHGARVQKVTNRSGSQMRALMRYLGKYMAKQFMGCIDDQGELLPVGRIWGIWGEVPAEVMADVRIGFMEHVALCRRLRKWGKKSRYLSGITPGRNGFRVLYDGQLLSQLLDGLRHEFI